MKAPLADPADDQLTERVERAFLAMWKGQAETDAFNQLVGAGLDWSEAALLRTYGQYLHQLGVSWSLGARDDSLDLLGHGFFPL